MTLIGENSKIILKLISLAFVVTVRVGAMVAGRAVGARVGVGAAGLNSDPIVAQ